MTLPAHVKAAAKQIQGELVEYLNIDVDPYDFSHLLTDWANSEDVDLELLGTSLDDPFVSDMSETGIAAFAEWLHGPGYAGRIPWRYIDVYERVDCSDGDE